LLSSGRPVRTVRHAAQVDADADHQLHRAESEVKGASEGAKLLWREMELGLER